MLHGYPNMAKITSSHVPQCSKTFIDYVETKMTPADSPREKQESLNRACNIHLKECNCSQEAHSTVRRITNRSFVDVKMGQVPT